MSRLKLPAYGRALLEQRRAGEHPLCVHVIVGDDWRAVLDCTWLGFGCAHPVLALRPEDCAPERFDWHLVAGLNVVVFDQAGLMAVYQPADASHARPWGHGPIYAVIGEIARYAADVEIRSGTELANAHFLAQLARDVRFKNDPEQNHGWPAWWSAETEALNAQRRQTWCKAALIERLEPEACAGG